MARPRKASPEAVAEAIDKQIQKYQADGDVKHLTDYALMEALGISSRTLDSYYEGEADKRLQDDNTLSDIDRERYIKSGYCDAVKRLTAFRRAECVQHIATGKASQSITGWIFLSKQPRWGGLQDVQRVEKQSAGSFTICIADSSGNALKE